MHFRNNIISIENEYGIVDEYDEYCIDQLTEMMHHSMFRRIVLGLAEVLGSDVVMRIL